TASRTDARARPRSPAPTEWAQRAGCTRARAAVGRRAACSRPAGAQRDVSASGERQKILQELFPVLSEHRFGVELHAPYRVLHVAYGLYLGVVVGGCRQDLERVGQ